jgi:hypothetical protein
MMMTVRTYGLAAIAAIAASAVLHGSGCAGANRNSPPTPLSATDTDHAAQVDVTSGLVGHWKLDEASGTTVSDASGNHYHAKSKPGPVWTTGKIGGGLSFDGDKREAVFLNSASPFITGNSHLSISAWVKHDSFDKRIQRYVSLIYFVPGQPEDQAAVVRLDAGKLHSYLGGKGLAHLRTPADLELGAWYHIVFTWDGSSQRLYKDGVEVANKMGGTLGPATAVVLGGGEGIAGTLDDIRIYNRELSVTEVKALYAL